MRLVRSGAGYIAVAVAVFLCASSAHSATPDVSDTPEVVVSGEQPGPGLWKVSKGDHVLWVLGTLPVLPKQIKWKMAEVDKAVASSQAVLSSREATADVKIGFFSKMMLLPRVIGIEELPNGATLQQVLPPSDYERWTALRQKYLGDSRRLERLRPFIAASKLTNRAYDKTGLADDSGVTSAVHKLVQHYHLTPVDAKFHFPIRDPKALIRDFKATSLDESACFNYELDQLEHSLAGAALQANAWATGDVATLKSSLERGASNPCLEMFNGTSFTRSLGIEDVEANTRQAWVSAAEKALSEYRQTFAMLGMRDVLLADGVLAMLQARGYTVQGPDE